MMRTMLCTQMTGKEFKKVKQPIVYIWKRGEEWLYVGLGKCGIGRFLGSHPHINMDKVENNDTICWSFYPTIEEAEERERFLIKTYSPRYNITHTERAHRNARLKTVHFWGQRRIAPP